MNTFGWDEMSAWWDEKQGDVGDLWHRALIDPPLLRLAGEVSGLHVLDRACGNGYLSRRFARQGATVTAVDANAPLIERSLTREAQESLGITYRVADAAHLDMLEASVVDLVICNMALMDIENAAEAIQDVARVLRPKGRFVASFSHPCFDKVNTSGWVIEQIYPTTTIWRKMSRYREVVVDDFPGNEYQVRSSTRAPITAHCPGIFAPCEPRAWWLLHWRNPNQLRNFSQMMHRRLGLQRFHSIVF